MATTLSKRERRLLEAASRITVARTPSSGNIYDSLLSKGLIDQNGKITPEGTATLTQELVQRLQIMATQEGNSDVKQTDTQRAATPGRNAATNGKHEPRRDDNRNNLQRRPTTPHRYPEKPAQRKSK